NLDPNTPLPGEEHPFYVHVNVVSLMLCCAVIAVMCNASALYDDFNGRRLNENLWQITRQLDRYSLLRLHDGHLEVYGNGRWRGVKSTCVFHLPKEGEDGSLSVTFKIRPAVHYTPSGHVTSIFDSSCGLSEEPLTVKGQSRTFGFILTYPKYSAGKYKVCVGGKWLQTQQPFTQSIKDYDFLRISIGRKGGKRFCILECSKDGVQWAVLHSNSPPLHEAVRIFISSCWGAIAVDFVKVVVKGAVSVEKKPLPKSTEKLNSIPFVYAEEILKGDEPKLDGRLDDEIWKRAQRITLSHRIWTDAPITQLTTAMVAYDSNNLYIAFECREDRMDLLRIAHKDSSGVVWQDDCVEVFIQPDPTDQPAYYFHAVVNALGVNWDDFGFHARWRAFAHRGANGWVVEMAIPFETIGTKRPSYGDCWGINFIRAERPHSELTSWSPVRGGFHVLQRRCKSDEHY
ncbi:MAG TPA: hypothetical protein EYP10_09380, partial [Armatimonadetes bacterium]|nr:hypothetical protein [Armatimonadota bacterium]